MLPPNNKVILSENIHLSGYANKVNGNAECIDNNRINVDMVNSATTSAGTTWADMVKRSGNCSIGETRLYTTNIVSNKTNIEPGTEGASLNNRNDESIEHNE